MKHLQLSLLHSSWLNTLMLFWMLLLVHHVLQQPNGCFACVEEERIALLDIKSSFSDPHSLFMSWNKSTECCSWYGVHCSSNTKHVRLLNLEYAWEYFNNNTLNVSLFLPLQELRSLILSDNSFNSCIPNDCFGSLAKLDNLEYLDLSWNNFDSKALSSLAALGSLKAISLHHFQMETEFFINGSLNVHKQSQMTSELFINALSGALSKLSKLKYLDLSHNLLNGSIIPYLGGISSLKTLDLRGNNMNEGLDLNELSGALSKLSKPKYLDLSLNYLNGSIIPYLGGIPSLKTLDLSMNNMGEGLDLNACQAWSNMSKLENLYLSGNLLDEKIFPCLNKASSLKTLDLSVNNMGANFSLKGLCKIKNLEELQISFNNMKGNIPVCFGHLSSFRYIDISYNQLGPLFPSSIIKNLTMLKYAIFSDNNFEDILPIDLFFNNTDLKVMDFSNNHQLEVQNQHVGMVPSFQLYEIVLSNCILNNPSSFPTFLLNQYMIEFIDLSSVNLKGTIPLWLFENKTKLLYLNLRNNLLHGPLIFPSHKTNLEFFDVTNNKLIGEIPNNIDYALPNIIFLGMSHNSLKGTIPSSFGNLNSLVFLDLSFNNLTGLFPSCIKNLSNLVALNLRENKLEGNLTHEFCHTSNIKYLDLSKYNFSGLVSSCNNMPFLKYLNINGNRLTGPFPGVILSNSLVALDIGNNNFVGNIPNKILTSLKNLQTISLKGNHFEGVLSKEICKLKYLRILDLSQNNLHGNIPSCLHMGSNDEGFFTGGYDFSGSDNSKTRGLHDINKDVQFDKFEEIEFSTKERSDSYHRDILNYLFGLDLSGNQFGGKIPEKIGEMTYLQALNLSNNRLSGPIPTTLSRLRDIESLDLSHNMLVGGIPTQLAELYSLGVFSVAYNNLSGPTIGLIAQFSTFNESSYEGNPYLCGPPLKKNCTSMVPSPNKHYNEEAVDRIIFFASLALGFIIGFWGWITLLYFKRSWQYSFFLAIDKYMKEAHDISSNLLMKIKSLW